MGTGRRRDRHSIERYHRGLDALADINEQRAGSHYESEPTTRAKPPVAPVTPDRSPRTTAPLAKSDDPETGKKRPAHVSDDSFANAGIRTGRAGLEPVSPGSCEIGIRDDRVPLATPRRRCPRRRGWRNPHWDRRVWLDAKFTSPRGLNHDASPEEQCLVVESEHQVGDSRRRAVHHCGTSRQRRRARCKTSVDLSGHRRPRSDVDDRRQRIRKPQRQDRCDVRIGTRADELSERRALLRDSPSRNTS